MVGNDRFRRLRARTSVELRARRPAGGGHAGRRFGDSSPRRGRASRRGTALATGDRAHPGRHLHRRGGRSRRRPHGVREPAGPLDPRLRARAVPRRPLVLVHADPSRGPDAPRRFGGARRRRPLEVRRGVPHAGGRRHVPLDPRHVDSGRPRGRRTRSLPRLHDGRHRAHARSGERPSGRGALPPVGGTHTRDHVHRVHPRALRADFRQQLPESADRGGPRPSARGLGDPRVLAAGHPSRRSRPRHGREHSNERHPRAVSAGVPDDRARRSRGVDPRRVGGRARRARQPPLLARRDAGRHRAQTRRGATPAGRTTVPGVDRAHPRCRVPGITGRGTGEVLHQPPGGGPLRVHPRRVDLDPRLLARQDPPGRPGARVRDERPIQRDEGALHARLPLPACRRAVGLGARRGHVRARSRRRRILAGFPGRHHRAQGGGGATPRSRAQVPNDRGAEPGDLLHPGDRPRRPDDLAHHLHRAWQHRPDRLHPRGHPSRPDPLALDHPPRRP